MPIEIGTGITIGGGINFGGGPQPLAPVNTVAPAVTGTATQGQTLTVSNGTWSNTPTSYTYQWQHTTTNISGATSSTYVLDATYVGETIRCVVTATNVTGSASATSNATSAVAALVSAPVATAVPVVSGTASVGQTLTTTNGTWTGTGSITYTYQWQQVSGGTGYDIYQATSSTYVVTTDYWTAQVRCKVTATNAQGSAVAYSGNTAAITSYPYIANGNIPAISGTLATGQVLTSSTGTWYGNATITYAYQWKRSGTNLSGATASTYTLVSGDAGLPITCTVTATNSYGSATSTSAAVATVGSYPSISAANEVFKFNYNTLASSANQIVDNSAHTWGDGTGYGSRGTTGLSQVSGGAYSGGGYYYNNANTGTNGEGITTLTGSYPSTYPYASYANSVLINANWAFETNLWITNLGAYNSQTVIVPYTSTGVSSIQINQQNGSSTAYQVTVTMGTDSNDGSGGSTTIAAADLTGGAWKHLAVQAVALGSGNYTLYVYVNGTLQNAGGTSVSNPSYPNTGLYAMATGGAIVGSGLVYSGSGLSYRLDNTRLILGAPFGVGGFTAPTSAFTA